MDDDMRGDFEATLQSLSTGDDNEIKTPPEPADSPAPPPIKEPAAGRDTTGRFAPREPAKNEVPEDQEQGTEAAKELTAEKPVIPAAPAPGAIRAPASWSPEEREEWGTMPLKSQQAVIRREREIGEALRTTAGARQFTQSVEQVLAPYMPMIQAEQSDPVRAIGALFQTAAVLRTAPPLQKASMLADLILQHNIDIGMLDNVLNSKVQGRPAPNDPMNHVLQALDQRLRPMQDFMSNFERQQQGVLQNIETQATQTLTEFMSDPKNEFAEDVREDMADLLDLAARRGQNLSLSDAYRRATLAHPTISSIMERRMLDKGAAQHSAAASRARNASASITDSGAPSQSGNEDEGDDVRSALGASIKQLSRSR